MIQVIERFHAIMELLAEDPERPRSLAELAERSGMSPPACANLTRTLLALGYLRSPGKRMGYLAGPTLFRLGVADPYRHLSEIAAPLMESLAARHGIMLVLVVENGGRRQELLRMEEDVNITIRPRQSNNKHFDLFQCATGVLLIGAMTAKRAEPLWRSRDANQDNVLRASTFADFHRHARTLLAEGKAIFGLPGGRKATMAFPLRQGEWVMAALGATVDFGHRDEKAGAAVINDIQQTAARINQALDSASPQA